MEGNTVKVLSPGYTTAQICGGVGPCAGYHSWWWSKGMAIKEVSVGKDYVANPDAVPVCRGHVELRAIPRQEDRSTSGGRWCCMPRSRPVAAGEIE